MDRVTQTTQPAPAATSSVPEALTSHQQEMVSPTASTKLDGLVAINSDFSRTPVSSTSISAIDISGTDEAHPENLEMDTDAEERSRARTRQKVIGIIDHQFDLEILLRHAERMTVEQELVKAERMLEDLRHAVLSEKQGAPYGSSRVSRTPGIPVSQQQFSQGTRQSARRAAANYSRESRMPEAIYAVRADGQFVRLGCPKCERYDFGSIQGLINHMRLSHKLVFRNTEEGVRYCGVVVPTIKTYDEAVDLETEDGRVRGGTQPLSTSASTQPLRMSSNASGNTSSNAGSESESDVSDGAGSGGEGPGSGKRRRSSLALTLNRPQKGKPGSRPSGGSQLKMVDSDGSEDVSGSEAAPPFHAGKGPMRKYGSTSQAPSPHTHHVRRVDQDNVNGYGTNRTTPGSSTPQSNIAHVTDTTASDINKITASRITSAASSRASSPAIHPLMNDHEISQPSSPITIIPGTSIPTTPSTHPQNVTGVIPSDHTPTELGLSHHPPIISFGHTPIQPGLPAPLDTVGSRFYVKRRIVVGNVSKFIPDDKRDPRLREFPYKWMIYVDGAPKPEDITAYVSKVEFHLHESYKPNDVITVTEVPFHLSRYAWGETQIKVRLFFHDARNKPVEVYHRLALDPTHCGRQVHGRERYVDLELDRNTNFLTPKPFQAKSKPPSNNSTTVINQPNIFAPDSAEAAMADSFDDDERELQDTLSSMSQLKVHEGVKDDIKQPEPAEADSGGPTALRAIQDSSALTGVAGAGVIDGVVSKEDGMPMRRRTKDTTLMYCKVCGSFWKQHRDGALGMAESVSEHVVLSEDSGEMIPHCPHHPRFYAVKDITEDEGLLLSLLAARTRNKFALDLLKGCGIVDHSGRPLSSFERLMLQEQRQQQQQPIQDDSMMELDIGDVELPLPGSTPVPALHTQSIGNRHGVSEPAVDSVDTAKVKQLSDAFQRIEVYKGRRSEIDWVLSVMDELKLKTLSLDGANASSGAPSGIVGAGARSGLRERDEEQERLLNMPGLETVPEPMAPRAVVGGLLVHATKAFLGRMLSKAIDIHRKEAEAEKGPGSIMMELDDLNDSDIEDDQDPKTERGDVNKHGEEQVKSDEVQVADKLLTPHHIYQALQSNPEELDFLTSQFEDMEGIGDL
ncbi:YEATS domain-containing protein 2 [Lunasporangiospora selenospora]|uniref:YEATS domain-containing protein 2 n=1 Tax=Lunasporangiospora selenospora TaxID=979761 RepID=A0A9P6G3J2_9FUNG|nr:YEATS domain-containing protein 2 [Lunasporangiospora selenospora]